MKQVTKGITKITKIANGKNAITKITDSDTESDTDIDSDTEYDSVLIKKETIPLGIAKTKNFFEPIPSKPIFWKFPPR